MEDSSGTVAGDKQAGKGKTPGARWQKAKQYAIEEAEKKIERERKEERKWEDLSNSQKWTQLTRRMKTGVGDFFGVANESNKEKWMNRSKHLMATSFLFGKTRQQSKEQSPAILRSGGGVGDQSVKQSLLTDEVDSSGSSQLSSKSKRMKRDNPDAPLARPTVWAMTVNGVKHIMSGKPGASAGPSRRSFAPSVIKSATNVSGPVFDFYKYPSPALQPSSLKMLEIDKVGLDVTDSQVGAGVRRLGEETTKLLKGGFVVTKRADAAVDKGSYRAEDQVDSIFPTGLKRMSSSIYEDVVDNTDRREIGIGFVGKWLDWDYNRIQQDPEVRKQMAALEANQHRPFFTYWVTFVQIVIYIFAIAVYGIAPIGISETRIEAEILKPSLSIEIVHYSEPDNLWIGPRQADLIHLGAKYSPCMRRDSNIEQAVAEDRLRESETACCIRNDGSGCVQCQEHLCSRTLSAWFKWGVKNVTGIGGRQSGSVCGQDPKYCRNPLSLAPYEWPDDITNWPICKDTSSPASKGEDDKHMRCEILGRPCCVGIQGQCIITTREFCQFRRGYFHEEATLCSQISCMNEICGMIPFYNPEKPNQFYRLWTSLFLHAGLFQLLISIVFQWFIMRDLEKLAGCWRIGIIYIMSGIAGSLGSAIFIPYHVEAGPSGSQFGILACVFVEVIQNWQMLASPCWALGKLTLILVGLFVIGLLPMIDNWAHMFGFIFGFLLSFAFLPYVTFNVMDKRRKLIGIIVCLITTVGMFLILVLLFYVIPIYKCPNCEYFNCIPFTPTFCKSMEVKITRNDEF